MTFDRIIRGGTVADGTGAPLKKADIGIKDGKIAAIGSLPPCPAETDARGKIVAPGFIDSHCHSDLLMIDGVSSGIKKAQGVTTEIFGLCGFSPAPVSPAHRAELDDYIRSVVGPLPKDAGWESVPDYMRAASAGRMGINAATYAAHGALRIAAMGFTGRAATEDELSRMEYMLCEAMEAGAVGLTFGLLYAPGLLAPGEELVRLARTAAKYDGIVSFHVRGEGDTMLESIREAIEIGRESGAKINISHLKAVGNPNWGKVEKALSMMDEYGDVDISTDVYPYGAGSTTMSTLLPPWSLKDGLSGALKIIRTEDGRRRIADEWNAPADWDNVVYSTGWESFMISAISDKNARFIGKRVTEAAEMMGMEPCKAALRLLDEENGSISIVHFYACEEDMENAVKSPRSMIISDSLGVMDGLPHPRLYGSFPKLFEKYVREKKTLSLEEAVHKMTGKPAARYGLQGRGLIKEGYAADITVFDPERIASRADYTNPRVLPDGIDAVFIAGKEDGRGSFLKKLS